MDSQKFWAAKRAQLSPAPPKVTAQNNVPWWQDPEYTRSSRDVSTQPMEVPQEHDFSKASSAKSTSRCANCGSGNFVKPSPSMAARCFDCGYIEGRQVNDLDTMSIMGSNDARTVKVKQSPSAQGIRIGSSLADINAANAQLMLSEQGKAHIDS